MHNYNNSLMKKTKAQILGNKYKDGFEMKLKSLNLKYIINKGFFAGSEDEFVVCDFYLPRPYKILFMIIPDTEDRAYNQNEHYLKTAKKMDVIKIKQNEVSSLDIKSFLELIQKKKKTNWDMMKYKYVLK